MNESTSSLNANGSAFPSGASVTRAGPRAPICAPILTRNAIPSTGMGGRSRWKFRRFTTHRPLCCRNVVTSTGFGASASTV